MALTSFVTKVTTIAASWLNAIDILWSTVFDEAATKAAARAAITSDAPFDVTQGGTNATTASTGLSNLGGASLTEANTFTAVQTINAQNPSQNITGAAGTLRGTSYNTSGSRRFFQYLDTTGESGSNVGSDYYISRYDDTAVFLDSPVWIKRSTGSTSLTRLQIGSPTGGDKGAGTINSAGAIYQNNSLVVSPYVATTAWTPVVTFATPGDLSVAYTTQLGYYTRLGSLVFATFTITTSTFTHTTASGGLRITGFPVTCQNVNASDSFETAIRYGGITKAGYHSVVARIEDNATLCDFVASGSGVSSSAVTTADCPTGGTLILRGTLVYGV